MIGLATLFAASAIGLQCDDELAALDAGEAEGAVLERGVFFGRAPGGEDLAREFVGKRGEEALVISERQLGEMRALFQRAHRTNAVLLRSLCSGRLEGRGRARRLGVDGRDEPGHDAIAELQDRSRRRAALRHMTITLCGASRPIA